MPKKLCIHRLAVDPACDHRVMLASVGNKSASHFAAALGAR
jgi:hypothetical protein